WQLVTIKTFNQGPGYQTWGGVGDRRWHAPARSLALILERETLRNAKGAVLIDGIEAVLDLRPIVPLLEVAPTRQGNVFLNNEEIAIPVQTKGDRIRWTVTDFFENIVARGEEPVVDTRAVIRPPVEKGYFLIELEAIEKGEAIGTARVPLGVITLVGRETMQDNRFGVMTHFAQGWDVDIMPLIAKAGIGSIRDEQYWAQVEKRRGEYAFSDKFTHYMAVAEQYGIRPLVPMTFSNKLYDEGLTPHTSEACDAYGRYGQAILNQYGDQIEWLEIWNEYNGTWCKGPAAEDRPKYYTQMLKHAYQRIKEVRPDVKVLGCATVVVPLPYLEGIFKHGGLDYMDAVVIHPYREQPEGVEDDVAELQEMIRMYNDGEDKPIWVTETGTFDRSEYDWELGKETYELGRRNAARYLVRQNVLLLSQDVEKIYWYLARDYNEFLTMGLLRSDKDPMGRYAVAPNYVAYATLIRQLHGARFARREPTQPHARVYLFQRESEQIRVCWATQPVHVALKTQSPVTVVDMMGGEETLFPTAGEISLTLNENPVYVRGAADTIGDSSVFQIEAEQDVDILNDVALQFTLDNSKGIRPLSGHIELQDRRFPVEVEPQSRLTDWLVIPAQDTSQARSHGLWYRLVLDGKPAAKGRILAHVVDPLSFSGRPQMIDDDVLQLRMANGSLRNDYQLTAVRWKCGDKNGTQEFNATLPHGQSLVLNMPFDSLPNYRALPVEIEAAFADRASLGLSAEVANAPCVKATIKVDGDLTDWQAIPSIDLDSCGLVKGKATVGGKAQIAWDDANFDLAASVEDETFAQRHTGVDAVRGDCLRFALAPAFAGNWCQRGKLKGWYEYVAAVTPDG
ncbi:MAG TPA: hypothetical protein VE890_01110, partial [Thermoguttaceae bacterium]|nr:hypothetical protein [Thermoguttaceae bacterium]